VGDTPLAGRKILVVDDQPSIRGILETALSDAGADVWCVPDGPTAITLLETANPELILLDLAMPGMNGWQVLEALSGKPRTAGIPVVLQTSAEDFASFQRARRHGVAAFVSKPFRLAEVVETCRRILQGARPLQGRHEGGEATPPIQLRDAEDNLVALGWLLNMDARGAQVDLESPLEPGRRLTLVMQDEAQVTTRPSEVRWVNPAGGRYHHGLVFLPG
jgi:CheY-like chemotaxis protein